MFRSSSVRRISMDPPTPPPKKAPVEEPEVIAVEEDLPSNDYFRILGETESLKKLIKEAAVCR